MIAWCFSDNADNDLGKTAILSYFMCVCGCRTVSGTSQMLWLHFVRTEMKVRTRLCSPTLRSFTVSLTSLEQVGQTGNLTYFSVYLRKCHPLDHIDKPFFIAVFIFLWRIWHHHCWFTVEPFVPDQISWHPGQNTPGDRYCLMFKCDQCLLYWQGYWQVCL